MLPWPMTKTLLCLSAALLATSALAVTPRDTLVITSGADIPTMDPGGTYDTASASIVENVYETLLTYKGRSLTALEPLLATRWAISNKGRTYTFDLRRNVKFHSGATLSCDDARYTFQRNLVTNFSGNGNWFLAESLLGTQANAYEDKTVSWARIQAAVQCNATGQLVFTLAKSDPAFLSKLAFAGQSIVERNYSVKLGEWSGTENDWRDWVGHDLTETRLSRAPNGTGAYRFDHGDGASIVLQAFTDYWGGAPGIKNVIRQKVADATARQLAFLKGDADFAEGSGRAVDEIQIKGRPGVTWLDNLPNPVAQALMMNESIKDPALLGSGKLDGKGIPADFFSNVNVRKAFSYAFNYDEYINALLNGKGEQRTMLLPENFPGYSPKVGTYAFNPAKAKEYFQKAYGGQLWRNGFVLNAHYRANRPLAQVTMEMLKKSIESLNPRFKVNLQPKIWSDLLADAKQGKESMALFGWAPDYADPDNFMYTFYASDGYYAQTTGYKDGRMDVWLKQAREADDTAERNRLYALIGDRAYDTAAYILMPASSNYLFFRSTVAGISAETFNSMRSTVGGVLWKDLSKN